MLSAQGFRIAELARLSGTSKETIHFYLREGLLRPPKKTGRNMAYYDQSHVDQLQLIKRLRTESYLPLNVIKQVLKEGKMPGGARPLDLASELFGRSPRDDFEPVNRQALAERAGCDESQISAYEAAGLVRAKGEGEDRRFGLDDVRIAGILKNAESEFPQVPRDRIIERFVIFERHLERLVQEELEHFFSRVITDGDPAAVLEMLRGGRETIGKYLAIARARKLRDEVDAMMPAIHGVIGDVKAERIYEPLSEAARLRIDEPARRAHLHQAWSDDPHDQLGALTLMQHLVHVGDAEVALSVHERMVPDARVLPAMKLLVGEAMIQCELLADAELLLESLRKNGDKNPMIEALWGASVLMRLHRNFATLSSSTQLISAITAAFSAFETARSLPAPNLYTSARIHLVLGRIAVATPAFLGARGQGKRDLEACLEEVATLRNDPAFSVERSEIERGALDHVQENVERFLRRLPAGALPESRE